MGGSDWSARTVGGTVAARYTYDPLDRRIGIQDNGIQTWVVWDGRQPYADFNGSGALTERYLYGPAVDEILARTDSGGTTSWYLTDREGSIRNLADSSGTVTGTISYDGFGKVLSSSGAVDRFGYTGREYDATTGLQYNRGRYYDAALGRWTQEDKSGFAGGDANLERYVGNSPTNASDPNGLEGDQWFNNDWTDWYNPFAYIGASGYASGDALGAGMGRLLHGNPGIALDVSRLRQERLVRELSDPGSSFSTADAARERLGALSNGLNEAGSYAADIGNGAVAAVELASDVSSIVNVGVSLRGAAGALRRRSRGAACPSSNAPINVAHPTFKPGPYAGESIPARGPQQTFTPAERAGINQMGKSTGCHTCGTTTPGTKSGNFVPDHQPVSSLNGNNAPQRLYPQCIDCSREQGLATARELRARRCK